MKKLLIVYYSWSCGNTKRIAELLQKETGGALQRLETVVPYEGSYNDVVAQGQREVNRHYQPALKPLEKDPKDYDIIVLGTPTWWYTMAPAMSTFLAEHSLAGKTVVPFSTHGGWPGHAIKDLEGAAKGAKCLLPKEVQFGSTGGDQLITPEKELEAWCREVAAL